MPHIHSMIMPSILDGITNGRLPTSIMMEIPSERDSNPAGYQLVIPAAKAYIAMHAHARNDGVILKPTSSVDTYRPFMIQELTYYARYSVDGTCSGCKTCVGYGRRCKQIQSNGKCPATAACPGTSNHGWGLAVDTGTELDGDYAAEPINATTLDWLDQYAWTYGFSWALLPEEPWHIQYCTGDKTPPAVYAYWNPPVPPTPPLPSNMEDVSKIKRVVGSTATLNITGSLATWVKDGDAVNYLIYSGLAEDGRFDANGNPNDVPLYALKGLTLIGSVGAYSVEVGPPRRDIEVRAEHFSDQIV